MASEKELVTKSLVDLYTEMDAQKQSDQILFSTAGFVNRFNELLATAKRVYPDVQAIVNVQQTQPIQSRPGQIPRLMTEASPKFSETKLKIKEMMNALGAAPPTVPMATPTAPSQAVTVNIQLTQLLSFSLDQLIQNIQQQSVTQDVRNEAEAGVRAFKEEMDKPLPDPSRLKQALDRVMTMGKEYAIPLLMLLLENWSKIFLPH